MTKNLDDKKSQFLRYVVCRKCFTLYDYENCFLIIEDKKQSKLCNHISFPNHRLAHMRRPCREPLLRDIGETGFLNFVPFKTFCYKTIKSSLQVFVKSEEFEDKCEMWRARHTENDMMYDIYDGNIWKEFNGLKYFFSQGRVIMV